MVRRSTFEVRMAVLRVTAEGCSNPTQIMYRSNTSWIILQRNLQSLIASGLVRQSAENSRTRYAVTDSGFAVVRDYRNLVDLASA